ncbi:MAG: dockerin type I domain-containing protein [Alistipes sp.]|nr:dockerin type I domain-containing protein [Alistipes sp.]
MKKRSLTLKAVSFAAVLAAVLSAGAITAMADAPVLGYMGDVNHDMEVNVADLVALSNHLLGSTPVDEGSNYNADMDGDGGITAYDLAVLRQYVTGARPLDPVFGEEPSVTTAVTTEAPVPTTTTTTTPGIEGEGDFIDPPIRDVEAYLPSQGDGNLVIFYIDFPDCQYSYAPSEEEIYEIAFGEEDVSDPNYPFDSMSAFYKRSSKGALNLKGNVFRYTTKNNQSYYNSNKFLITQECYEAFKDSVDFSQYDGDGDGYIDATLLTVPTAAGDDYWWPCAGPVGQDQYKVDGKMIGHIITGNAQIESPADYSNFNSSYLHEMGHCMGLPDYYLYSGMDSEGMHGLAGIELMDTDATTDFGAVSKLQLGWYTDKQIQIFDGSQQSVTYTLNNAQGGNSNCVIIPANGVDGLNNYHSEYFILEYTTPTGNNSNPAWWVMAGEGVRVYHAETTLYDNGWWVSYKYGSGSEFTDSDNGRRYLRIIDDVEADNLYHPGDVIDNSILGFNWYDSNAQQTIDPGVTITVNSYDGESCSVTISKK